jgi:hypothetical protein
MKTLRSTGKIYVKNQSINKNQINNSTVNFHLGNFLPADGEFAPP